MKIPAALEILRPEQWAKNSLLFACGFFALADKNQSAPPLPTFLSSAAAFGVFCLLSGAVYAVNDIHDAAADRVHPVKCRRPVASGRLGKDSAAAVAAVSFAFALAVSTALGHQFALFAVSYVALQAAYTFFFKRVPIADAVCIATGFALRVTSGAAACSVAVYPWIIESTFLLALFLALGKRRAELAELGPQKARKHRQVLARYSIRALDIWCSAVASAAIVGYSAWALSPANSSKFGTHLLPITILPVAFAILRYLSLILSGRGGGRPEKEFFRHPELTAAIVAWFAIIAVIFAL